MTTKPSFSLAICTYNRAPSLARLLRSLEDAMANAAGGTWEVLVVDNNSTDSTREICNWFAGKLPLRYVFEGEQGLSNARNRAIAECAGDLLVFTDDDVVVDRDWLREYARGPARFRGAAFFGGRVLPMWDTPRPGWLRDEKMPLLSGLLVNYDLGDESRWLAEGEPGPFGASFAITRELFEKVGDFRPDLGVKGEVPGRGEEADYLQRAVAAGFRGAYLATAVCHHPVDPGRLSPGYLYRYGVQKGIAERRMRRLAPRGTVGRELMYGVRGLWQLVRGRGDRFRQSVINMGIQRGLRCGWQDADSDFKTDET